MKRHTTSNTIVYRAGGFVYKLLRDRVPAKMVRHWQSIAAEHSDILEPFEYDEKVHLIKQRDLGDKLPTSAESQKIRAAIRARGLRISDISPSNIRGGKVIDFEAHSTLVTPPIPYGIVVECEGKSVSVSHATHEEIEAAGITHLIKFPEQQTHIRP